MGPWGEAHTSFIVCIAVHTIIPYYVVGVPHSKRPHVGTTWGTNGNVGNLGWGSESVALITEDAVHAALTRLFTRGNSDQCSIEELMAEMDIPLGFELQEAIVKELQMLEDKNCLMYRERVIHLI